MEIGGIIALVVGALLLFAGRRQKNLQSEMAKSSVAPIAQLVDGQQAEVYGTVSAHQPLLTPFSKRECVYYEYKLERENRVRNAQGMEETRWEQIASDSQRCVFQVQDSSGVITIDPQGADIDPQSLGEQYVQPQNMIGNPLFQTLSNMLSTSNSRATEKAIVTGSQAYILGSVHQGPQGMEIGKGGKFFISYKSEKQVEKERAQNAMIWTVIGVIAIIGGVALLVASFF